MRQLHRLAQSSTRDHGRRRARVNAGRAGAGARGHGGLGGLGHPSLFMRFFLLSRFGISLTPSLGIYRKNRIPRGDVWEGVMGRGRGNGTGY
jgi:hypothetical protein